MDDELFYDSDLGLWMVRPFNSVGLSVPARALVPDDSKLDKNCTYACKSHRYTLRMVSSIGEVVSPH